MELVGWQRAVYEALRDLSGPGNSTVSRHDLLQFRMFSLMERAGSGTGEPGQAVSLALQRLRDKGLVEFVGIGMYRLPEPDAGRTSVTDIFSTGGGETRQRIETDAEGFVLNTEREVVAPQVRDLPPAPPSSPPGVPPALGPGDFGRLEFLPASQLKTDDYQRAQAMLWVERKARVFDWRLILPLTVNLRATGDYYVIDGQHRTLLLIFVGYGEVPVPIYLYEGLSAEQEAELFLLSQKPGARRSLSAVDVFWAEYFRGESEPQGVAEAVSRAGGRIPRSTQQQWEPGGTIRALAQLRRAWRSLETDGLAEMLLVLRQAWGLGGLATSGIHIRGAEIFWSHYGAQVDRGSLIQHLSQRTPGHVLADATAAAISDSYEGKAYGMAMTLLRIYNRGRTSHRLPMAPLITAADRRARQGQRGVEIWKRDREPGVGASPERPDAAANDA